MISEEIEYCHWRRYLCNNMFITKIDAENWRSKIKQGVLSLTDKSPCILRSVYFQYVLLSAESTRHLLFAEHGESDYLECRVIMQDTRQCSFRFCPTLTAAPRPQGERRDLLLIYFLPIIAGNKNSNYKHGNFWFGGAETQWVWVWKWIWEDTEFLCPFDTTHAQAWKRTDKTASASKSCFFVT